MNAFDLAVFGWFNGLAGRYGAFDRLVVYFTKYAPFIFGLLFVLLFVWRSRESGQLRRTIMLAVLSGALGLLVAVALASVVYRPRPFVVLPHRVKLLLPHAADSSFPSDHATGSAGFAVGMWRAPSSSIRWLFTLVALLVGVSRLIAGVHWPSDILGSYLLGALSAQVVWAMSRPLSPLLDWMLHAYERAEARFSGKP